MPPPALRSSLRLLALLVSLAFGVGACSKEEPPSPPPRPAGRPLQVERDPDITPREGLSQFKAAYEKAYRLQPDARITLALAELDHLLTGKPRSDVEVQFQDGRWQLRSGGADAGSLPEFPDFADALALLEARARQLGTHALELQPDASGKPAANREELSPFPLGRKTFEVLHQLNRDWAAGKRTGAAVREGARAMVSLSFQSLDLTETATIVPARAFAQLALARVITGSPFTEEQALLAVSLGYTQAARQLSAQLSPRAPLRLFLEEDDTRLGALAAAEAKRLHLARYLWVRRIAEMGHAERLQRLSKLRHAAVPDIHELAAYLRIRDFNLDRQWGLVLPTLVLREVATAAGSPGDDERAPRKKPSRGAGEELASRVKRIAERFDISRRGILPPFEEQLARVGDPSGFFLGAEAERAWFQALFFSAQYRLGLHYLDSLSSAEAADKFSKSLGSPSSPAGQEFVAWMTRLVQAKSGGGGEAELMKGLTELKSFGAAPLLRMFEELQDAADWGDPALSTMVRRLAAQLDTRPRHRNALAKAARSALSDFVLAEKLYRANFAATGDTGIEAWLAWIDRDTAKLRALLASADSSGRIKLDVLKHLVKSQQVDPAQLKQQLAPLLSEYGDEWSFTSDCVELLESHQRYADARAVAEQWVMRHPNAEGFERIFSHSAIARMHYREGNPTAGWEWAEPLIPSQQFGAMQRGALLLQALGEEDKAVSLAQQLYRRYPRVKALAVLAEVLWRSGRHEEAAKALASPARPLRTVDWRWHIGERFAAVFSSRPVADGRSAFLALRQARIGATELSQLTAEVSQAGNAELAFDLLSRVSVSGLQQLELLMRAYGDLKKWKGEEAALTWLKTRVSGGMLEPLSMFAFRAKASRVLWEVVPDSQGQNEGADYVWLMRAASSLQARDTDAVRQTALRERFGTDRASFYHQLGRYLMGLTSEEEIIATATTPKSKEELPFFLGFKAQVEGRYADTVTWYRAAIETGNPRMGEYRWAYDELSRLRSAELSLARMKEQSL
ncbi:MAG TPA: hypothetical protein VNA24_16835 [Hyalangium sp.]|nr:hypothetical protein [Hyalangium sp.]